MFKFPDSIKEIFQSLSVFNFIELFQSRVYSKPKLSQSRDTFFIDILLSSISTPLTPLSNFLRLLTSFLFISFTASLLFRHLSKNVFKLFNHSLSA